ASPAALTQRRRARAASPAAKLEVAMDEGDRYAALADGRCHALHRSGADIADGEDSRGACFESERLAISLPLSRLHRVGSGQEETVLVACDPRGGPGGRRV